MTAQPARAMVMAAGLGKRMRPLTDTQPKPMIDVAGTTLIDRALDWLAASGVDEAVVNTFYKAEMLERHLSARTKPRITFSREESLLETGGGIARALPRFGSEPFFSINSDTICIDGKTPALARLWQAWDDKTMDALLLLHPVEKAVGYDGRGDFFPANGGRIRRRNDTPSAPLVFTGVQLLHPRLFDGAPAGAFSLNLLYDRGMDKDGTLHRVCALVHDGDWLHIGDPQGLADAESWLSQR